MVSVLKHRLAGGFGLGRKRVAGRRSDQSKVWTGISDFRVDLSGLTRLV